MRIFTIISLVLISSFGFAHKDKDGKCCGSKKKNLIDPAVALSLQAITELQGNLSPEVTTILLRTVALKMQSIIYYKNNKRTQAYLFDENNPMNLPGMFNTNNEHELADLESIEVLAAPKPVEVKKEELKETSAKVNAELMQD